MKVSCDVKEVSLTSESGAEVDGVEVTCSRCDHVTESFGTTGASVRRCLALMREECEYGEENYYVAEGADE